MMTMLRITLLTALLFFPASNAKAQGWDVLTPQLQSIEFGRQIRQSAAQSRGEYGDQERPDELNVLRQSLQFSRNKSRTATNLKSLGKRMAASDPAKAAQAEQLFASNDVIGAVQGVMDQYGLQKNNVAHAYALYWVVYWGLANNVHDAPSERAMQAVAAQAERGFAANAEFAQLDNAAKQAAAEELMALTAIFDATSEQAKSDPALAAQVAKASLEGSRKSGLELDKMTLTEEGFVPRKGRKGADASDLVRGDRALASAESDNTVTYGIMGVVGLGAAFMIGKGMRKA
jgi:hypothetical protein